MKLKGLRASLEAIDFQKSSDLLLELDSLFGQVIRAVKLGDSPSSYLPLIDKVIFKRFGLKIRIRNVTSGGAYVYIFPVGKNNILFHDDLKDGVFDELLSREADVIHKEQQSILNDKSFKGIIDIKNAKVSGSFSMHEHFVGMSLDMLVEHFGIDDPRELSAILLHEVGHAFTWYEYSNRIYDTNQVLQELKTKEMVDSGTKSYILSELSNKDLITKEDARSLLDSTNEKIFGLGLIKALDAGNKSFLENRVYAKTSSEQLADNFAAKLGYGKEIVLALNKFPALDTYNFAITQLMFLGATIHLASFVGVILALIFGPILSPGVLIGLSFGLVVSLLFTIGGTGKKDFTYDDTKIRYQRVRNQLVELLRLTASSKKEVEGLLDSIQQIDKIINKLYNHRNIIDITKDWLLSGHRKAYDSVKEQQLLEKLTSNNLFIKSKELQMIGH